MGKYSISALSLRQASAPPHVGDAHYRRLLAAFCSLYFVYALRRLGKLRLLRAYATLATHGSSPRFARFTSYMRSGASASFGFSARMRRLLRTAPRRASLAMLRICAPAPRQASASPRVCDACYARSCADPFRQPGAASTNCRASLAMLRPNLVNPWLLKVFDT